ncbi:hypothetical protein H8356DRAFT_948826 [Neocallimastix lanati (nom. inval.)]|nr:hypothetical protein H8356DRAFT_948826 [Neocallimastix sp. JGI-2020a]
MYFANKNYEFWLLILLYNIYIYIGKTITFNAIAHSYSEETEIYSLLVDEFNKYSKQNNLNINLKLNLLSVFNSSNNIKDYESTLEYIFKKDDTKYDIIFYDKIHSKKFGSYLLDLQDFIPEKIKEYDSKIYLSNLLL